MVRFGPNPFPVLSFRRQSYVISGNNLFLVCLLFIQLSFYFKSLFIGNVIRFQMGKVHFSLVSFWTSRVYEMNHGYWFTPVLQFTRVFGDCLWNLWNRFFSGLRFLIACVVWLISSACFVNSKGNDLEKPLNLEWLRGDKQETSEKTTLQRQLWTISVCFFFSFFCVLEKSLG